MIVNVKPIDDGKLPAFQRNGDAAADCYANESKWVWLVPKTIKLGFAMELPADAEAVIRPRSGLTSKGHYVMIGTIDSNYRGECKATMWSLLPYQVKKGDRVCQLACRFVPAVRFVETEELSDTNRGTAGFGSSGR